jgi:hypothetical protein
MKPEEAKYCVGYRLKKDATGTLILCHNKDAQNKVAEHLKGLGYTPILMSAKEGEEFLDRESKKYEQKPLTAHERWFKWALGK